MFGFRKFGGSGILGCTWTPKACTIIASYRHWGITLHTFFGRGGVLGRYFVLWVSGRV